MSVPEPDAFDGAEESFLQHYDTVRGRVRLQSIREQVLWHVGELDDLSVVDIGAGDGVFGAALAGLGARVDLVEPNERMAKAAERQISALSSEIADRLRLVKESATSCLDQLIVGSYDLVLLHGVIPYFSDPTPFLAAVAALCKPSGTFSVVSKSSEALAWRPALQQDWKSAIDVLATNTDAGFLGKITKGYTSAEHIEMLAAFGLRVEAWYGVRIFVNHLLNLEADSNQFANIMELELAACGLDPYRRTARLVHFLGTNDDPKNPRRP